jgi:hypothetical protein
MSFFSPDDYRYWTSVNMTPDERAEDIVIQAEKLKGANEDYARYKAFQAEIEARCTINPQDRMPIDRSASPASSDFDWYKRRES